MKLSYWRRNMRVYCSVRGDDWNVFLGGVRIAPVFLAGDIRKLIEENKDFLNEKKISLAEVARKFVERCKKEMP